MDDVALGLREALEAEHQWLLASIEEDSNGGSSLVGKQITKGFLFELSEKGVAESIFNLEFLSIIFL